MDGGIDGSASIAAHFASSESPRLLGETAAQQAEVNQWVNFGLYTLKPGIAGKVLRVVRDSARVRAIASFPLFPTCRLTDIPLPGD